MTNNSDIFNSYANLMKEKGLLVEASEEARIGSDDLSTIEMLYGIKPNGKDEKDMVDQAHPKSCVISPAYDRINGLIENVKERQQVMNNIVLKPQQANFKFRYVNAAEDLKNELIRVGFLMDNENQKDIAVLADTCLDKMVKEAALPVLVAPFVVPVLIGVGIAALYLSMSHKMAISQGVIQDSEQAYQELQGVLKDYPELGSELGNVINLVMHVHTSATKAAHLNIGVLQQAGGTPSSPQDAAQAAAKFMDSDLDKESISILEDYKNECLQLSTILPRYIAVLKLKAKQLEPTHSNFWEPIRHIYRFLVPSDMEDAWDALQRLTDSLVKEPALVDQQISLMEQMRNKYQDVLASPIAKSHTVNLPTVDLSDKNKPQPSDADTDTLKQLINT